MSDSGTVNICEYCKMPVDPSAPDVVWYVERIQAGDQWLDGNGCFFHRAHLPSNRNPNYRLATGQE